MKKIFYGLSILLAIGLYSCAEESALTDNPIYDETATGDDPKNPGNGGGNGNGSGNGNGGGGSSATMPTLMDTAATQRVAVLEDFTGVRCVFCPDGHTVAKAIDQQFTDRFIIIATHGGSFATPGNVNVIYPGPDTIGMFFADFRTPFADPLISQADVAGYPAGTMNRIDATVLGVNAQRNGSAMSRSQWQAAAGAVLGMSSPVNIGAQATMSGSTLTVDVELYYTAEETEDNSVYVALLQDGIESIQVAPQFDSAYIQDDVLRHYLTGQWGDESNLSGTKDKGLFVTKTYTYDIPAEFHPSSPNNPNKNEGIPVIEDMKVVAFVARGREDILTAVEVPIN